MVPSRSTARTRALVEAPRFQRGASIAAGCALLLAIVLPGAAAAAEAQRSTGFGTVRLGRDSHSAARDRVVGRFVISGSVHGLYPGVQLPLQLTVTNPGPFTIDIASITTTVSSFTPACPSALVTVTAFTGSLRVRPGHSATATVTSALAHSAPNTCQGAQFLLRYDGTATVAP